jgi:hypothetical protein
MQFLPHGHYPFPKEARPKTRDRTTGPSTRQGTDASDREGKEKQGVLNSLGKILLRAEWLERGRQSSHPSDFDFTQIRADLGRICVSEGESLDRLGVLPSLGINLDRTAQVVADLHKTCTPKADRAADPAATKGRGYQVVVPPALTRLEVDRLSLMSHTCRHLAREMLFLDTKYLGVSVRAFRHPLMEVTQPPSSVDDLEHAKRHASSVTMSFSFAKQFLDEPALLDSYAAILGRSYQALREFQETSNDAIFPPEICYDLIELLLELFVHDCRNVRDFRAKRREDEADRTTINDGMGQTGGHNLDDLWTMKLLKRVIFCLQAHFRLRVLLPMLKGDEREGRALLGDGLDSNFDHKSFIPGRGGKGKLEQLTQLIEKHLKRPSQKGQETVQYATWEGLWWRLRCGVITEVTLTELATDQRVGGAIVMNPDLAKFYDITPMKEEEAEPLDEPDEDAPAWRWYMFQCRALIQATSDPFAPIPARWFSNPLDFLWRRLLAIRCRGYFDGEDNEGGQDMATLYEEFEGITEALQLLQQAVRNGEIRYTSPEGEPSRWQLQVGPEDEEPHDGAGKNVFKSDIGVEYVLPFMQACCLDFNGCVAAVIELGKKYSMAALGVHIALALFRVGAWPDNEGIQMEADIGDYVYEYVKTLPQEEFAPLAVCYLCFANAPARLEAYLNELDFTRVTLDLLKLREYVHGKKVLDPAELAKKNIVDPYELVREIVAQTDELRVSTGRVCGTAAPLRMAVLVGWDGLAIKMIGNAEKRVIAEELSDFELFEMIKLCAYLIRKRAARARDDAFWQKCKELRDSAIKKLQGQKAKKITTAPWPEPFRHRAERDLETIRVYVDE